MLKPINETFLKCAFNMHCSTQLEKVHALKSRLGLRDPSKQNTRFFDIECEPFVSK